MHANREFLRRTNVGLALVAMPLSGVHVLGWASVSTPRLLGDRTFSVAGMETGDHRSVAISIAGIYRLVEWMQFGRKQLAWRQGPALHIS